MSSSVCPKQIRLVVNGPDVSGEIKHITDESSIIVGSSDACKIRLIHESVSPKHCLLRFNGGKLTVQDWFSNSGTLIDGTQAIDEVNVERDCQLTIGSFNIEVEFKSVSMDDKVEVSTKQKERLPCLPIPDDARRRDPDRSSVATKPPPVALEPSQKLQPQSLDSRPQTTCPDPITSLDTERIDLLLGEMELLQSELALRDAKIEELENDAQFENGFGMAMDEDKDDDAIKERLNELLDELARSDQRIRALEDLLQISEDATADEREERRQIEAWVNDLERRIGDRESEWQAEIEVLNARNEELKSVSQDMEGRLTEVARNAGLEAQEQTIRQLRNDVEQLQAQLEDANTENKKLNADLQSASTQNMIERQQECVEAAIREEHVRLARERAEMSRQKAELLRRVAEHEQELSRQKTPNAAEQKFRAFRQHLKEIHENEKRNPPKPKPLSKRLMELWQRLDGPTDTD